MGKPTICIGEDKGADKRTAKLIRAFVFATWIVQFLYFPNPKFEKLSWGARSNLLPRYHGRLWHLVLVTYIVLDDQYHDNHGFQIQAEPNNKTPKRWIISLKLIFFLYDLNGFYLCTFGNVIDIKQIMIQDY